MNTDTPITVIDPAGRLYQLDPYPNGPEPIDPTQPILPPKPPTPAGGPIDTLLHMLKVILSLFAR